jgi:hypothetical protein
MSVPEGVSNVIIDLTHSFTMGLQAVITA